MIDAGATRNDRPPYSYVPGGPFPHPVSDPGGHSAGHRWPAVGPIEDGGSGLAAYLRGVDLFNDGYYWEAHEAWEANWHAEGRAGSSADVLKALIKLAAAGVKVREGQPRGVHTHAGRAAVLLESVAERTGSDWLGLDLRRLGSLARDVAERPPAAASGRDAAVAIVFGFRIEPTDPDGWVRQPAG